MLTFIRYFYLKFEFTGKCGTLSLEDKAKYLGTNESNSLYVYSKGNTEQWSCVKMDQANVFNDNDSSYNVHFRIFYYVANCQGKIK